MQSLMKLTFVALIAVFGAALVTPARAQSSNRVVWTYLSIFRWEILY